MLRFSNEAGLHLVDSIVEDAQFFQIAGDNISGTICK